MANLSRPTNNLMSNIAVHGTKDRTPQVGMGATIPMWTDRHAATIVEVIEDKHGRPSTVIIQRDIATRADKNGMSDDQQYTYAPNPDAGRDTYTRRKNGHWVRAGEPMNGGQHLIIGERSEYHDYCF